jgi:trk system potassium uptake protein
VSGAGPGILRRFRAGWAHLSPPAILVLSIGGLVVVGTLGLLLLPGLYTGQPLGFLDALFTMTSAVCITGLVVVDTATYFTRWGQAWILLFVQLGGLGLISLTTLVIGALGQRLSLRSEVIVSAPVDYTHRRNVVDLALSVARFTLAVEAVGALLLFLLLWPEFGWQEATWHAVFHAVSAFCNSGFSTFGDSLNGFRSQPGVLLTVSWLVVLGGIGYLTSEELLRYWRARKRPARPRLSVHSWAAVVTTAVLLAGGFLLYLAFEWNGVLRQLSVVDRLTNAFLMSVTARSSGFASVDYGQIANSSAYLTILLMVAGGAPGSTAGGLKTTTLAVLAALAWARGRGRRHVELHGRTIPEGTVERTVSVALAAFALMSAAIFLILMTETRQVPPDEARGLFLPLMFEVVSAFCTVGLSMGVTPELSGLGRLLTIFLIFVGRVGPLAFFAAISLQARRRPRAIRAAQEDLIVG